MTRPLTVFLVAVAAVLLVSLRHKFPRPPLAEAANLLADGDMDGAERRRMLRITVDAALGSSDPTDLWVGMLAAVALDDAATFARLRGMLGDGELPDSAPPAAERARLDLGDPVVRNVAAAMLAEIDGDPAAARTLWKRVDAQCRLSRRPLAALLAAQAHLRLS
ncbi:MAG: hypothetical protein H6838_01405 [Planctomycetes bacterium]|nr:hypothetical protein [Planctomycetota bacterium]